MILTIFLSHKYLFYDCGDYQWRGLSHRVNRLTVAAKICGVQQAVASLLRATFFYVHGSVGACENRLDQILKEFLYLF